ncbi:MAG: tRNA guanosine(34) transglycosylase Tgt [Myxococcales bacterium]|nr:tRNA guanosine(34) transglycosylase Tgt [Myxococcales bacterium]MCB9647230.1 tRNA guanosine(34) transglycosylase Tgt [Deltaproteobacteria bacterium]
MRTVRYELHYQDPNSQARLGRLISPHGAAETPAFMPVGTGGSVKAMLPDEVAATGAQIILGNTFHLMHRPGHQLVAGQGGLHTFMGWDHTILTDSGGFQVFSLAELAKITEEGVRFKSPYDGSRQDLTPERSIEVQEALGTDIAMAFDECPPSDKPKDYVARSMDRTTRWLDRCLAARRNPERTSLFGIVQGGLHEDLRRAHAETLIERDLDGYAVGGVAIGESKENMARVVSFTTPLLPVDRPRYLMGVGLPEDLVRAVMAGIDMFDCVVPTRNARTGRLFTWQGLRVVKHARYKEDRRPIDETCGCPTCARFSRAYLRHLWLTNEILVHRLTTMHNLWFFQELMRRIRAGVREGTLQNLLAEVIPLTTLAED